LLVAARGAAIDFFVITCEHGGNGIPAPYRSLFDGYRQVLDTHRGYDAGALLMARDLAAALGAPLVSSTVSRLLVDLNRSIGHPAHFSAATRDEPAGLREEIVARYYQPYRQQVVGLVARAVSRGRRVIHVSSHSFVPKLHGKVRNADVGLLYHTGPVRRREAALCARWKASLAASAPQLRVRRNYPYAGKGDGLTSYLRRRFPADSYSGIELEVNQAIVQSGGAPWEALRRTLIESLRAACANPN
jgi:predicted N-formylglutamate amidohydrolase